MITLLETKVYEGEEVVAVTTRKNHAECSYTTPEKAALMRLRGQTHEKD
jgi:hypothetical protein